MMNGFCIISNGKESVFRIARSLAVWWYHLAYTDRSAIGN